MSTTEKRTITLPAAQAQYIDSLISTGAYNSLDDIIAASLSLLQEQNTGLDDWLRTDVLPICAAMDADPSLGRTPEQVADRLRAHHAQHSKVPS